MITPAPPRAAAGTRVTNQRDPQTRAPWRTLGFGAAVVGTPVGVGYLHPAISQVIIIAEILTGLVIVTSALFGSQIISDRAFRLLRWLSDRPEPPQPARTNQHSSSDTEPDESPAR
jgi:hypothetical protein